MAETKSLYPKDWSIIFAGIPLSEGFDESKMIQIEKSVERFKTRIAIDGQATRVRQYDESHTVTIYLTQTSEANAALSALYNLGATDNGLDVGTFVCKDRKGTSSYFGATAWIEKPPTFVLGNEAQTQEWVLRVPNMKRLDGGA
jgi:hypothetical protein